jgi:hypothetical protein
MIVREKAGCSLLPRAATCFFVTLELRDDEPPFDVETPNGTAGIGTSLYMLVDKDKDSDLISLCRNGTLNRALPESAAICCRSLPSEP